MQHRFKVVASALLAFGALAALGGSASAQTVGTRVVAYAHSHLGRQVGRGECWDLAYYALRSAGAHLPGTGGYGTYQFGRRVPLSALRPGNVLQFEGVTFRHTQPSGAWYSSSFPHHTAIVYRVYRDGRITLIQQNTNGVRRVSLGTIRLRDRQPGGTITAYRPQPR